MRVPREARLRNCRDARALLAKLHAQAEPAARFDLRLLQLEDGGQPQHVPTAIRIGSRLQSLVISAVGNEAVAHLAGNASKAGTLVARHYGIPLDENYQQGECDVQAAPKICTYHAPSFVLSRRRFDREQEGISMRKIVTQRLFDHPLLIEQIKRAITDSIQRQANVCLLDVPQALLGDLTVHRLAPVLVKPSVYFVVGAVSFRVGWQLVGPWYVGHLQSRGYGRIFPARHGSPTQDP